MQTKETTSLNDELTLVNELKICYIATYFNAVIIVVFNDSFC